MEALTFPSPDRAYLISYDEFGDVLYVKSEESRAARKTITDDDGFQWRLSPRDGRPAGFTVHDFNYVWEGRAHQLAERIGLGMMCGNLLAEGLAEAITAVTAGRRKVEDEIFAGLPADRPVTPRGAR